MKKITTLPFLFAMLICIYACADYKPIFGSANLKFEIADYSVEGDKKLGTKIYSPMDGIVLFAGYDEKVGHYIIISHGEGYQTKYFHNKKNLVSTGDPITTNKPIAEMGKSGALVEKQATHLHFELLKDGTSIDPEPFIHNIKSVVTVSN